MCSSEIRDRLLVAAERHQRVSKLGGAGRIWPVCWDPVEDADRLLGPLHLEEGFAEVDPIETAARIEVYGALQHAYGFLHPPRINQRIAPVVQHPGIVRPFAGGFFIELDCRLRLSRGAQRGSEELL